MTQQLTGRHRTWSSLTDEEKQACLADLRRRQQLQIEREVRELRLLRRG